MSFKLSVPMPMLNCAILPEDGCGSPCPGLIMVQLNTHCQVTLYMTGRIICWVLGLTAWTKEPIHISRAVDDNHHINIFSKQKKVGNYEEKILVMQGAVSDNPEIVFHAWTWLGGKWRLDRCPLLWNCARRMSYFTFGGSRYVNIL